ncbi:hypothetical protein BDN72DRAFT_898747 [Pluteus cervinus]|uniref:Uncharacterized protein n=1 Tax=Pluteus cervinus TaxID=181527 RepID=A0ACD3APJ3_9AGAR|nr:hypothetical protein BDN72DRAFT_898747 [Pluteus cervinus]
MAMAAVDRLRVAPVRAEWIWFGFENSPTYIFAQRKETQETLSACAPVSAGSAVVLYTIYHVTDIIHSLSFSRSLLLVSFTLSISVIVLSLSLAFGLILDLDFWSRSLDTV